MLILASGSPQRKELLKLITEDFKIIIPVNAEVLTEEEALSPKTAVAALAKRKSDEIFQQYPNDIVVAADTLVSCENELLGKPKDDEDAKRMITKLSSYRHTIVTGVSIMAPQVEDIFTAETEMELFTLSEKQITDYITTGAHKNRAGAFDILGGGRLFVKSITGDYNNVIGLPVGELYQHMQRIPACHYLI